MITWWDAEKFHLKERNEIIHLSITLTFSLLFSPPALTCCLWNSKPVRYSLLLKDGIFKSTQVCWETKWNEIKAHVQSTEQAIVKSVRFLGEVSESLGWILTSQKSCIFFLFFIWFKKGSHISHHQRYKSWIQKDKTVLQILFSQLCVNTNGLCSPYQCIFHFVLRR